MKKAQIPVGTMVVYDAMSTNMMEVAGHLDDNTVCVLTEQGGIRDHRKADLIVKDGEKPYQNSRKFLAENLEELYKNYMKSEDFVKVTEELSSDFLDSYLNLLDRLDWRSSKPQLLFTTHSPIIVSDFLPQDIVSLFKDQDGVVRVKDSLGFGTNITNLFIDGMHIESTIGEHSRKAIVSLMQNANTQSLSDLDRELVNSMGNKFVREFLLKK